MSPTSATRRFAAIVGRVAPGHRLLRVRPLEGGVSASIHALDLLGPDGGARTVVLRHFEPGTAGPDTDPVVAREHALSVPLHRRGLPVPEPLLVDTGGELLPVPYRVTAFVEGSSDTTHGASERAPELMADVLVRIHRTPLAGLPTLPRRADPLPEPLGWLPDEPDYRALRSHLSTLTDTDSTGPDTLLHGDYWPGNLLWRDGAIVAVLDWEDAAIGDPLSDVACCRLELRYDHGGAAAERFTAAYARERPLDARRLALWQVYVSAAAARFMGDWGLSPERERHMRAECRRSIREAAEHLLG